jgi:outer membrane beta-barrel protein
MRHSLTLFSTLILMTSGILLSSPTWADGKRIDMSQDVDTLGGNEPLMGMAQALDPENRSRIVQHRTVDLHNRLEFNLGYGAIFGGDPYLTTQSFLANLDYHINPNWAVALRYNDYGSSLNSEGQRMLGAYQTAVSSGGTGYFVDTDAPQQSGMAVIEWSPFYGKINFFDKKVVQFDFYALAGGGEIQLEREGFTPIYTAGAGMVFWFANHISARLETSYQGYKDQVMQQGGSIMSRNISADLTSLSLGYLL